MSASAWDSRAVIATLLVLAITGIAFYAMYLKWPLTDILGMLAFFGPFVSAAIAFYFGVKNESNRIALAREKIALEREKLNKP